MSTQLKIPAIAGTLLGTALGAAAVGIGVATLPIALPVGAVAGIVIDVLRRKHNVAVTVTPPPPIAVMRMLPQTPTMAASAAKAAAGPPVQATILHSYLLAMPASKLAAMSLVQLMPALSTRAQLVRAFQTAFNADPHAGVTFLHLKLPVTGVFDAPTASGLAFYTHDPIPADPVYKDAPASPSAANDPSASASASLDLSF
jgi:hypothetical protein